MLTIVVRSVFEEDTKYYPQIHLDGSLYELWKCYSTTKIDVSKGIDTNKAMTSKECMFCHYPYPEDVLLTAYELKNIKILNEKLLIIGVLYGVLKIKLLLF